MKQVLFLYNPQSGKGKIEKDSQAIGEMFRQAGYSIVDGPIDFSRNPFNGHETVDLVVVAGGSICIYLILSFSHQSFQSVFQFLFPNKLLISIFR